jgi:hypothetical protein
VFSAPRRSRSPSGWGTGRTRTPGAIPLCDCPTRASIRCRFASQGGTGNEGRVCAGGAWWRRWTQPSGRVACSFTLGSILPRTGGLGVAYGGVLVPWWWCVRVQGLEGRGEDVEGTGEGAAGNGDNSVVVAHHRPSCCARRLGRLQSSGTRPRLCTYGVTVGTEGSCSNSVFPVLPPGGRQFGHAPKE